MKKVILFCLSFIFAISCNHKSENKMDIQFKLSFMVNSQMGELSVKLDGKKIESGTFIRKGKKVIFEAKPKDDFHITGWTLNGSKVNDLNPTYELEINKDSHVEINFAEKNKKEVQKQEIQVEKIVVGKTEYLNETSSSEKSLKLLENGKEELLFSEDSFDIAIHIVEPKDLKIKLSTDSNIEELHGHDVIFEKKEIAVNENFKTFKLNLLKDGYVERTYSFKAKRKPILNSSIPKNLRIKKLSIKNNYKTNVKRVIKPSSNGIDYNVEYPASIEGCMISVYILGENENAEIREKNREYDALKADGKRGIPLSPLPGINQTKTFVIEIMYNGEKFYYNINTHVKGE